jgi:hypothetical protein
MIKKDGRVAPEKVVVEIQTVKNTQKKNIGTF